MWEDLNNHIYTKNSLFIGGTLSKDESRLLPVGVKTEQHAITIAGAGAGKGISVIIPNLLKWSANALVIDPKGEAVDATAIERQKKGQAVHVLDPFRCSSWEERATYNPLDSIDHEAETAREDIGVLADGIVMRGKGSDSSHWDDGASKIIGGVIAVVCLTQPPELRNLITVREIISDKSLLDDTMNEARSMKGCGNLPQNGASAYFAQEGGYFVSNAEKNTSWLDSPAIQRVLEKSSFSLSELKDGNATVYLCLPAQYLSEHGRFLRLMVRSSISAMQQKGANGKLRNKQCLFLLDEFFALGYIEEIAVSAGLMRGFGLQLWPILQDLGQLNTLYGEQGAQTFFGNAGLHQFFGNMDAPTLNYVSDAVGVKTQAETHAELKGHWAFSQKHVDEALKADEILRKESAKAAKAGVKLGSNASTYIDLLNEQEKAINKVELGIGKKRLEPQQIASLVAKSDGEPSYSKTSICVISGQRILNPYLIPYWLLDEVEDDVSAQNHARQRQHQSKSTFQNLRETDLGEKIEMVLFFASWFLIFSLCMGLPIGLAENFLADKGHEDQFFLVFLVSMGVMGWISLKITQKLFRYI